MVAFASNSILCRVALGPPAIDASSFAVIRLLSGAFTLLVISLVTGRRPFPVHRGDWVSGAALTAYAIAFSFAYIRLDVGTGALLLFAVVQTTMVIWGIARGDYPRILQWLGLVAATCGLVYLVAPGLSAPSPTAAALMGAAGLAWGVYSLRGIHVSDPIAATTRNFVASVPLVLIAAAFLPGGVNLTAAGVVLAVASGSLASGMGYAIWYAALPGLPAVGAAAVQLTVPVIAAGGGVLLLGEQVSARLVVAAVLILGGAAAAIAGPRGRRIRP